MRPTHRHAHPRSSEGCGFRGRERTKQLQGYFLEVRGSHAMIPN